MKRSLLIISSLIAALSFSSCVKDYTCQCKITFSGKPGLPEPQIREYELSNTLKQAKEECENRSQVYTSDGVTTTEACELY